MTETETVTVTAHETPGGKLAVKATAGDLSTTKYVVGGYPYYVLRARAVTHRFNGEPVEEPYVELVVLKRTSSYNTALKVRHRRRENVLLYKSDGEYKVAPR